MEQLRTIKHRNTQKKGDIISHQSIFLTGKTEGQLASNVTNKTFIFTVTIE